jgi:hypothetical protein
MKISSLEPDGNDSPRERAPLPASGRAPAGSSDALRGNDTRTRAAPPWIHALVRVMDEAIRIPGTNFKVGWDAILGLIFPVAGDAVSALSHIALLLHAFRAGVPGVTIARMLLNVAIDQLWGSVPILGDLFDAGFRANRKNLDLIESRGGVRRRAGPTDYLVVASAIAAVIAIVLIPFLLLGGVVAAVWSFLGQ